MKDFVILSDSCCDLNKEMRERFGIDYVPMRIIYGETDIPASLDWEQISFKQFYDMMRDGVRVKTAMITADEFRDVFIKYLDEGKDVMYIACSSALSNSYKSSLMAHDILAKERPDGKIICIDSLNACMGLGMICMTASDFRPGQEHRGGGGLHRRAQAGSKPVRHGRKPQLFKARGQGKHNQRGVRRPLAG